MLTAIINDVASQFGCIVDLNDAVTAVTLVAMGTSVPGRYCILLCSLIIETRRTATVVLNVEQLYRPASELLRFNIPL